MKIAFSRAIGDTLYKVLANIAVKLWTSGPYGHCELIATYGSNNPAHWIWYGAKASEGIVKKTQYVTDLSDWDIYDINIKDCDRDDVVEFLESTLGAKYDWAGIFFTQILFFNHHTSDKWFCSELVRHALCVGRLIRCDRKHNQFSPNSLFREMVNKDILGDKY